jgi:hypothetical protein
MAVSFAKLCQLNDTACKHFACLLLLSTEMRRGAARVQGLPGILKGVAQNADYFGIKCRCVWTPRKR